MKSKKEGNDQESIKTSNTPDPGYQWESDNIRIRHHKRENNEKEKKAEYYLMQKDTDSIKRKLAIYIEESMTDSNGM